MLEEFRIHTLIPDLPPPAEVLSYLQEMHGNRWYSNFGPIVRRFEAALPDIFRFCDDVQKNEFSVVTLTSATAGLELAIRAMDLKQGDKVLIPALTFPATALAVINAGLEPVICDVDPETWELTPSIARKAVEASDEIRLVMPVATYGKPIEVSGWEGFQRETGTAVIFDAAAALGQQVISREIPIVFSLHATKPMGIGEGGAFVTSNVALANRVRELSNFGFSSKGGGLIDQIGTNAKMGEYYAAVGLAQLARFDTVISRRELVRSKYLAAFQAADVSGRITLQKGAEDFIPAVFCVGVEGMGAKLHNHFSEHAIQTRRWYLPPLHMHPAFQDYGCVDGGGCFVKSELPAAKAAHENLIGLPFHAFLGDDDIAEIVDCLFKGLNL